MGGLVKANALVSENRQHRRYHQCFYETTSCREIFNKHFFASIFMNFQKILVAHQKNVPKIFREFTKKHPQRRIILVKLQEGVLRKVFAKFTGKHLRQRFYFNKVVKKRFWRKCFPVNLPKLLRTPFLQNTSGRLLLPLAFLKSYEKRCS